MDEPFRKEMPLNWKSIVRSDIWEKSITDDLATFSDSETKGSQAEMLNKWDCKISYNKGPE